MGSISEQLEASAAHIRKIFRESSLRALKSQSQTKELTITELNKDALVFGHYTSLILVVSNVFRFNFKAHFMSDDAKFFSGDRGGMTESKKSTEQDFMREFCNVTAGILKRNLETAGLNSGISLPLVSKGYIELFFRSLLDSKHVGFTFEDHWQLKHENAVINCTLLFEVLERDEFIKAPMIEINPSQEETIEFL